LLNNELIQTQLLRCAFKHTLFHTPFRNKTVDMDLLRLSDAVRTIHRLKISLGIPTQT
jgi:hypothetical protein